MVFSGNPLVPVIDKEIVDEVEDEEEDDDDDNKRINIIKPKGLKKLREKTIEMAKKTFILHYISEIKKIDSVIIKDFVDKIWESFEEGLYGLEKVVLEYGIDLGRNLYQDMNHFYYIEESLVFFYNYREKDENNIKENKERVKKLSKKFKDCYGFSIFCSRFQNFIKFINKIKKNILIIL